MLVETTAPSPRQRLGRQVRWRGRRSRENRRESPNTALSTFVLSKSTPRLSTALSKGHRCAATPPPQPPANALPIATLVHSLGRPAINATCPPPDLLQLERGQN
ncbi:hypothetical protein J6590_061723 [Homalodisca vitripennis]|nr:hypothetical protein J6590_061723 [Homalodisca vitripennis]